MAVWRYVGSDRRKKDFPSHKYSYSASDQTAKPTGIDQPSGRAN
jgi:hypothetical protein